MDADKLDETIFNSIMIPVKYWWKKKNKYKFLFELFISFHFFKSIQNDINALILFYCNEIQDAQGEELQSSQSKAIEWDRISRGLRVTPKVINSPHF